MYTYIHICHKIICETYIPKKTGEKSLMPHLIVEILETLPYSSRTPSTGMRVCMEAGGVAGRLCGVGGVCVDCWCV